MAGENEKYRKAKEWCSELWLPNINQTSSCQKNINQTKKNIVKKTKKINLFTTHPFVLIRTFSPIAIHSLSFFQNSIAAHPLRRSWRTPSWPVASFSTCSSFSIKVLHSIMFSSTDHSYVFGQKATRGRVPTG